MSKYKYNESKSGLNEKWLVGVAMTCMICTQSCWEGPGNMTPWKNKTNNVFEAAH